MDAVLSYLFGISPILGAAIIGGLIVWLVLSFYQRAKRTENEVKEVKTEVRELSEKTSCEVKEVKAEVRDLSIKIDTQCATKADMNALRIEHKADMNALRIEHKADILALKENDFFHTNKAMLIGFSALLKDDPQRFERLKDAILESTPDNRKDEINSITI